MDVMRYVDSDLIEEASSLFKFSTQTDARHGSNNSGNAWRAGVSSSAQDFMNENVLGKVVTRIAGGHELLKVDSEVLTYLAMATKQRLQVLIERMIHASRHRRISSLEPLSSPPMYDADHAMFRISVGQDVKSQLLAIERVERQEELRYKEHVALRREQRLTMAAGENSIKTNEKAKKRVRIQVGAKVKHPKVVLTKEEKLRFTNQTALGFAGNRGKKEAYAWMVGSGGVLKRPQVPDSGALDDSLAVSSSSSILGHLLGPTVTGSIQLGRCSPPEKVNVKDMLFCLEQDCGSEGAGLKVLIKNYIR
ncbi:hypothetical protein BGZ96_011632 [Linnemannia gamsii]|uniref:Transcription initiation factor TFIID subunit 4 n=1 Tax=Linnemannia gamsii TaxID=64522 RepID=A0ABQ7JRV8_9FUNG|nr:hypothetical protein BGZ96_011632 [Linnemannia gamsii]